MFIVPRDTLRIASKKIIFKKTFKNVTPKTLNSVINYIKLLQHKKKSYSKFSLRYD